MRYLAIIGASFLGTMVVILAMDIFVHTAYGERVVIDILSQLM